MNTLADTKFYNLKIKYYKTFNTFGRDNTKEATSQNLRQVGYVVLEWRIEQCHIKSPQIES